MKRAIGYRRFDKKSFNELFDPAIKNNRYYKKYKKTSSYSKTENSKPRTISVLAVTK